MIERTFKIRSRDDLINAPDPKYLIDQVFPERGLAVLFGSPGVGKTFCALGISLSICTGLQWLGYNTCNGSVIYITSEGLNGLKLRLQAWESYHEVKAENFGYVTEAPNFLIEDEIQLLIEAIESSHIKKPSLIVIDTLARHMIGGDENSAQHMGAFIANADKIRTLFNSAVIIVHHTTKKRGSSTEERGSSALRGAADTMLLMDKNKKVTSIKCEKQKDSEPFENILVALKGVNISNNTNSCVLVKVDADVELEDKLDKDKEKILNALYQAGEEGLRTKYILDITGIPQSSYHRHREYLVIHGFIAYNAQNYYTLTSKGVEHCSHSQKLSSNSHESLTTHSHNSHTPLGVGVVGVNLEIEKEKP